MNQHDAAVADFFEWVAGAASWLGPVGMPIKAIAHAVYSGIRERGVTTDTIVASLHKAQPLEMPWNVKQESDAP